MANVTIPAYDSSSERQNAIAVEAAQQRRKSLDAPWYTEKLDPANFGANEFLDPQHIAMFNGTKGGRSGASFPERTLDSGLHFNPTPSGLTPPGTSRDVVSPQHPEILTAIVQDLWSPSTSNGALGQALAVATDAPPSIAGPSEPPLTVSPPLDPSDLPPPPDPPAADSSRAKRQAAWAASSEGEATPKQQPTDDTKRQQEAADKRKRDQEAEEKRKRDEAAKK